MTMASSIIRIEIVAAVDLPPADLNGFSDPYVKEEKGIYWVLEIGCLRSYDAQFRWKGQKYKTEVKRRTLNPQWNASFPVQYDPKRDEKMLTLEIWDWDRVGTNDPLGRVQIDLSQLKEGLADAWFPVEALQGVGRGQLRLKLEKFLVADPTTGVPATAVAPLSATVDPPNSSLYHHQPQSSSGSGLMACVPAMPPAPFYLAPAASDQAPPAAPLAVAANFHSPPPIPLTSPYCPPGRKKALLVGVNYVGTKNELRGCINDAVRLKKLLVELYSFADNPNGVVVLRDDSYEDPRFLPSKHNITEGIKWLVAGAQAGDTLVFFFSGRGTSVLAKIPGTEEDNMDEAIVPSDFKISGFIRDNDLNNTMIRVLPTGVRLVAVLDCGKCGTGFDLPYVWHEKAQQWHYESPSPVPLHADVQLFSACGDGKSAFEFRGQENGPGGAMTGAFMKALRANPYQQSYRGLLAGITNALSEFGVRDTPLLTSSFPFDMNRQFTL